MKLKQTTIGSILLLILSLGCISSSAQFVLNGQVRDMVSLYGVPGHSVLLRADTSTQQSFIYNKLLTTDNQGFFQDTIFTAVPTNIKFYFETMDCNQSLVVDSVYSNNLFAVNLNICTNGINMCMADFVAYPDSGNYQTIHFYNLSSFNTHEYIWDLGDGSFSTATNPAHTYNLGKYQVCLTATDTVTNCSNTFCDSILVSPVMNCTNSFTYNLLAPRKYSFQGSVNGAYPTLYYWDFGDITTANGKNVSHQYNQPGSYIILLTTISFHPQTLDTCIAKSQQVLTVTGSPTAGIWGQVFADSQQIDMGMVYLYSYDANNESLTLMDSALTRKMDSLSFSYYLFSGLPYGTYVTYLKPLQNSIFYNSFAPAYSGNTMYWDKATICNLTTVSTNVPINLTHIYEVNGSGTISGYTLQGNKANPGDPIAGIPIYLLNQNKVVVGFKYSDNVGYYSFDKLSNQKYYVYADVINHSIFPANCIISEGNLHHDKINIYIGSGDVTSVSESGFAEVLKVYPNPASDEINLKLNNIAHNELHLNIHNLLGQKLLDYPISTVVTNSSQNLKVDISSLKNGVYILQLVQNNEIIYNQKLIITK